MRIREAAGVTYFETSTNGTNWWTRGSYINQFDVTDVEVRLYGGVNSIEATTSSITVDNFFLGNDDTYTSLLSSVASNTTINNIISESDNFITSPGDKPPDTPHAKDDEFNDASFDTGLWTWRNQDAATAVETAAGLLRFGVDNTDTEVHIIDQAVPATTYTINTKVSMISEDDGYAGLTLVNGSGALITFGPSYSDVSDQYCISIDGWNSVSSYNSNVNSWCEWGVTDIYLQIEDDGTDFTFYASADGINWSYLEDVPRSGGFGAPTRVGLFVGEFGGDTDAAETVTSVDWFRVNWTSDYVVGSGGGGGGGSSSFASSSGLTRLITTTNNVTLGSTTEGGKLLIDGDTDEVQLEVEANASQTANILEVTNNGGTLDYLTVQGDGDVVVGEADTIGQLFIVDIKTDAGDPAGTEGAIYYNDNINKFRCYQNTGWTDCISAGGGGGAFSSAGGQTELDTTTDNVTLGSSTAGGKLFIDGDSDELQLQIQGNGTQTNDILVVENSAGTDLFTVDTTRVQIGEGEALNTTTQFLVLDTKNSAGDPTGVAGAMYYNSNAGEFRCFATSWTNCSGGGGGGAGANTALSNLSATSINQSLLPSADDNYDLGASSYRWRDLYLGPASLHIGTDGDEGIIGYDTSNNTFDFDQSIALSGANSYFNFGGTNGSSGYGIRDNAGVLEFKNASGDWAALGTGGGGGGSGSASPVPQIESSYTTQDTSYSTDVDLQIPAGTQDGDLLVAVLQVYDAWSLDGITGWPTGWNFVTSESYGSCGGSGCVQMAVLYRVASGDTPATVRTFDYGNTNEYYGATMLRISGANPVLPINAVTTRSTADDTEVGLPAITTTEANTLGIGVVGWSYPDALSGWTEHSSANVYVAERDFATATTYAAVEDYTDDYASIVVAIAPYEETGYYAGVALEQDDFDDNSIDTGLWDVTTGTGTSVNETGQELVIGLPTAGSRYADITTDASYDVRGRWAGVQLVDVSNPTYDTGGGISLSDDGGTTQVGIEQSSNRLIGYTESVSVFDIAYNSTNHQYLRIREASGFTYWETSADGTTWNTEFGMSNWLDMSDVTAEIWAGTASAVAGTSTYTFDNFYIGTSDQTITFNPDNSVIIQGGNSLGEVMSLGTNDAYNLQFRAGGEIVAEFDDASGAALFQGSVNAVNAFDIQNSVGTSLLSVDTANNRVYVGDSNPDTTGTILVLDTKNTAGDPTGVDGGMYYNSNSNTFRCNENGEWRNCIGGLVFANTSIPAGNIISDTTAETNFASNYTIPADDCQPGRVYKVTAYGTQTNGGSDNGRIRLKLGSTTLAQTVDGATTATDGQWSVEAVITCITAGASGSVEAQGRYIAWDSGAADSSVIGMSNTSTTTINTTSSQVLQLSLDYVTSSASVNYTLRQIIVEAL